MDDPLLGDTRCRFREKVGNDETENVTDRRDEERNILRMVVRNPCNVVLHRDAAQSEHGPKEDPWPYRHDSRNEQVYDKGFVVILFIPWDRDSLSLRDDWDDWDDSFKFLVVGHDGRWKNPTDACGKRKGLYCWLGNHN